MVGNLYDDPKYADRRDTAFSLFYMAINIGALFAPTAASKITEHFLGKAGLKYQGDIPALCHEYLEKGQQMAAESLQTLSEFAQSQAAAFNGDLAAFAHKYINELSLSYHYGFAVACVSLIVSMLIYQVFKRTFKHADVNTKQAATSGKQESVVELTPAQTKSRMTALFLVFAVVIFFWMAFHQNGLTLTFFARDYTARTAAGALGMSFNVFNLVFVITLVYSLFSFFQSKEMKSKLISVGVACLSIGILVYKYMALTPGSFIEVLPQMFQHFNPFLWLPLPRYRWRYSVPWQKEAKNPQPRGKLASECLSQHWVSPLWPSSLWAFRHPTRTAQQSLPAIYLYPLPYLSIPTLY